MKKILVYLAFWGMAFGVSAQVDTFSLRNMPQNYYVEDWPNYSSFTQQYYYPDGLFCLLAWYNQAPICIYSRPQPIYGITPAFATGTAWDGLHIFNYATSKYADSTIEVVGIALVYPHAISHLSIRELFLLNGFDALTLQLMDTGMNVIAEGSTMLVDSVGKPVFRINEERQEVLEALGVYDKKRYDIYEVYFTSPVTVTDSFYLAAHFNSFTEEKEDFGIAVPQIWEMHHYGYGVYDFVPPTHYYDFPRFVNRARGGYRIYYANEEYDTVLVPEYEWFDVNGCEENHGFAMIFPILNMTCGVPENITWVPMGSSNVLLHWAQGECNTGWEVSYGPSGTLPGDGTVVETTSPSTVINGLLDDARYVVYVRARCAGLTAGWSEWSDSVVIALQGIDAVGEGRSVELHPNPAGGEVALTAEAELKSVEVYTSTGARYTTLPAAGRTVRFDTSAWPVGTYLLVVGTDRGTVTRRLSVAR